MSQNQEKIEARLCDYVEGTLDESERAEIEKHLAANPGHRKLIGELLRTREMVQKLPRVKAPGDVSETLQGQLERSVLLGAMPEDSPAPGMRIGGWARWGTFAAAAVLMLALGGTMYFILRSPRPPFEVAAIPKSSAPISDGIETIAGVPTTGPSDQMEVATAAPTAGEGPVRSLDRTDAESAARSATESPPIAAATPAPAPAAVTSNAFADNSGTSANASGGRTGAGADAIFGLSDRARRQPGEAASFICVADPSVTNRQVTDYLEKNKIAYSVEPMPPPLGPDVDKAATYSRVAQNAANLKLGSVAAPAARQKGESLFVPGTQPTSVDLGKAEGQTTRPAQVASMDAMMQQPAVIRARNLTLRQSKELSANLTKSLNQQQQVTPPELVAGKEQREEKDALGAITGAPNPPSSTQPAASDEKAAETTANKPLADVTGAYPATTPATTEPAEESHVDLLIVVGAPAPSTQPSTQPAAPTTQPESALDSPVEK